MSGHTIRRATVRDLPQLQVFFRRAHGEQTVLQDGAFLRWFFGAEDWMNDQSNGDAPLTSYIAVDSKGSIVSHYGYLRADFSYQGSNYPFVWGVSAYTLPAHRNEGLGKALVRAVQESSANFGVIGFSEQTAQFYDKLGFNVFGFQRYQRHLLILDPALREVLVSIGADASCIARDLNPVKLGGGNSLLAATTEEQTLDSWNDAVPEKLHTVFTRRRTHRWLRWRFARASLLAYQTLVTDSPQLGRALIAYRVIALTPTSYQITKIVDLYGDDAAAAALLLHVCRIADRHGHQYVQFDCFGPVFAATLARHGFIALSSDDDAVFPSLYNPVAFRPNREYVGLFSKTTPGVMAQLRPTEIYLTQADSDRDRRASV